MRPTRVRYLVLLLLALAPLRLTDASVGPFNTTLVKEFRITKVDLGVVIAGFSVGYTSRGQE